MGDLVFMMNLLVLNIFNVRQKHAQSLSGASPLPEPL